MKMYTSKIFEFSITQNLLTNNPMERIITPKRQREIKTKENQNFLDKNQLKSFLTIIEKNEFLEVFALFRVLAYTGVRKGELSALTWSDIDFSNFSIQINKSVSYLTKSKSISTTKNTSSERGLSIDEQTIAILKKWKFEQKKLLLSRGIRIKKDNEQLIFSNKNNDILRHNVIRGILQKYPQFDINVHGFRHTHASLLFEAGATIKQVQERLGHSDIKTTLNIYTHVTKNAEKEVANLFSNFMNS